MFNKRASITSFAGYYYKILPLYEYFVTWWVFSVPVFELFLELLFLDLFSCCVRARFFRWWDGLADLLQSGLLLRTAGSVSLPECRHVGAQGL